MSQVVTTKFALDWQAFLAAQMKFVVVSIDGRGTGSRGKKFESEIYKNLGVVEVKDQMDVLRSVASFHFVLWWSSLEVQFMTLLHLK